MDSFEISVQTKILMLFYLYVVTNFLLYHIVSGIQNQCMGCPSTCKHSEKSIDRGHEKPKFQIYVKTIIKRHNDLQNFISLAIEQCNFSDQSASRCPKSNL